MILGTPFFEALANAIAPPPAKPQMFYVEVAYSDLDFSYHDPRNASGEEYRWVRAASERAAEDAAKGDVADCFVGNPRFFVSRAECVHFDPKDAPAEPDIDVLSDLDYAGES